jgi:tetratricopeptide (TPR) repeat protein
MAQEQLKTREVAEPKRNPQPNGATKEAHSMAVQDDDVVQHRRPTSFAKFLRDIVIVLALLGGGGYTYWKHIITKGKLGELSQKAVDKLQKDDLESLNEAEGLFKQMLALDSDNDRALSGLAETYFHQWRHGLQTRDQADQMLRRAISEKSDRPERYATQAYLLITSGQAAQAEREIKDLLDKGIGSSKLAHAYGWAKMEQGNFAEANQVITRALEAEFSGVRYALTLAENAHRQGFERAAVSQLRRSLESSMNPKHELAHAWIAALQAKNYGNIADPAKHIQDVQARKEKKLIGPRTDAFLSWAEGELALAVANPQGALDKAEEAIGKLKDYAPFFDLKARALLALKKQKEALEVYEQAIAMKPEYRGIKRDLIALKSERKDDSALALIDELQKETPSPGPEFEIMRGEHYLKKGDVDAAKAAFEKAADLGDNASILFGLAKVAFLEEKKKSNKADLERVATAFQTTLERQQTYPEVHEYMAQISLWNFDVAGASNSFNEAETQFKKRNISRAAMSDFYDRAIDAFKNTENKGSKAAADKASADWKKRKDDYLASVGG